MRRRAWEILEVARPGDGPSAAFDLGIRALIALNVVAVVLETEPVLFDAAGGFFLWFEVVSVVVFSVEYVARVWSAVEDPRYRRPVRGRLRWAATPMALVDLMAVLPAFLPFLGLDFRFLRGVRLMRLFRILKIGRYSRALRTLGRVFTRKRPELILTLCLMGLVLLFAGSLMYFIEHEAQPEAFASIPRALWWGIVTLTTLGYGDVIPVTPLGKVVGGMLAVSGVLLIALPTAILGSAFVSEMEGDEGVAGEAAAGEVCPHCGRSWEP